MHNLWHSRVDKLCFFGVLEFYIIPKVSLFGPPRMLDNYVYRVDRVYRIFTG